MAHKNPVVVPVSLSFVRAPVILDQRAIKWLLYTLGHKICTTHATVYQLIIYYDDDDNKSKV